MFRVMSHLHLYIENFPNYLKQTTLILLNILKFTLITVKHGNQTKPKTHTTYKKNTNHTLSKKRVATCNKTIYILDRHGDAKNQRRISDSDTLFYSCEWVANALNTHWNRHKENHAATFSVSQL